MYCDFTDKSISTDIDVKFMEIWLKTLNFLMKLEKKNVKIINNLKKKNTFSSKIYNI